MPDIIFDCPQCNRPLKVDESGAGLLVDCPECAKKIQIPASAKSVPATAPATPPPLTKACPYCGEQILEVAKKCKHCGEILNQAKEVGGILPEKREAILKIHTNPTLAPTGIPSDSVARCPKCGCTSIQGAKAGYSVKKGCLGLLLWPIVGPLSLFCGACGKNKMYSHCLKCGHKWKHG